MHLTHDIHSSSHSFVDCTGTRAGALTGLMMKPRPYKCRVDRQLHWTSRPAKLCTLRVLTSPKFVQNVTPTSLSELIAFESDEPSRPLAEAQHEEQDPSAKAAAILDRAVRALEAETQEVDSAAAAAAAAALPHDSTPGPGPPAPGAVAPPPSGLPAAGVPRGGDATRAVLHRALLRQAAPGPPSQGSDHSDDGSKSTRPSPSEDSSRSRSSSSSSSSSGGGGGRGLGGRRADLREAGPVPDLTSRGARAGPGEGGVGQPSWAQALFGECGQLSCRAGIQGLGHTMVPDVVLPATTRCWPRLVHHTSAHTLAHSHCWSTTAVRG
ncbi:hypothetical protein QJQ45_027035 [Haematococcus lacustris]|nr:hypothetical protein QJQ45_027035 [Haematococcus lacustris]